MTELDPSHAPRFRLSGFRCPHCYVHANQQWNKIILSDNLHSTYSVDGFYTSRCDHCGQYAFWVDKRLVYPESTHYVTPNDDLSDEIKADFDEARRIVQKSPRGAAALLRLCIQKVCIQLGESGKNIDSDIATLVKKGLSPKVQRALDTVRVIGNESVHPGTMDMQDNTKIAYALFSLVNLIADEMISKPKFVDDLYNSLPETKLEGIKKRDEKHQP